MERKVFFDSSDPGPFAGLIDLFVEQGRQAALQEANPDRRSGILDGLQACEDMRNGDLIDFELALLVMQGVDSNNHMLYHARETSLEECYRSRSATVAVIGCREILRVAHHSLFGELPAGETRQSLPSYAVERYEKLTTELGQEPIA